MNPEVTAAVSAAVVAFFAAVITVMVNSGASRRDTRERQQGELFTSALDHLVGHSQPRSVGIAALTVFLDVEPTTVTGRWPWTKKRKSRLDRYGPAVARLLSSQLAYLLVHGENRGKAHEIGNIAAIGRLLFASRLLKFVDGQQSHILLDAMGIYAKDPLDSTSKAKVSEPIHCLSIENLKDIIKAEWTPLLGNTSAATT